MATYDSTTSYIETFTSLKDKLTAIDAVVAALYDAALAAVGNDGIKEYTLDDTQTKIMEEYRSSAEIQSSIMDYEKIRQMLLNQMNGRVRRMVDYPSNRR